MSGLSTQGYPDAIRRPLFVPFAIEEMTALGLVLPEGGTNHSPRGGPVFLKDQPGVEESDGQNVFIRNAQAWQSYRAGWRVRKISEGRVASLLGLVPADGKMIYFTANLNATLREVGTAHVSRQVITLYDHFDQNGMSFV